MLELCDKSFKITMINLFKDLLEKIDNMHEQMGNFSRDMEIIGKSQMEELEIKNSISFYLNRLISKLNTAEKRISKLKID